MVRSEKSGSSGDSGKNGQQQPASVASGGSIALPQLSLPKGGGATRSLDEQFKVNAVNGTASLSIPLPFSASRSKFMPALSLSYNSGTGKGAFGLGWALNLSSVTRRTDRGLPRYADGEESDVFVLSGAEDLVPLLQEDANGNWIPDVRQVGSSRIMRYRPRIESQFARIEKITGETGDTWWRVTNGINEVSIFGKSSSARIADPRNPSRIFQWLPEFSYDDKGNCFQYVYKAEDTTGVKAETIWERNRINGERSWTNAYPKRILYGNRTPFDKASLSADKWDAFLAGNQYLLEMVFDYGEHDDAAPRSAESKPWPARPDAFSNHRPGFEIRSWRLCRRLLMFHHFEELGNEPCLVKSLDLAYSEGDALTFLTGVTLSGYIRDASGTYSNGSVPQLEFDYQPCGWDLTLQDLPETSMENLPAGVDGSGYQFIDLFGEGIPGVISEQANNWYYKANAGNGILENSKPVSPKPAASGLSGAVIQFENLDGGGHNFLLQRDLQGFYELDEDDRWSPFRFFRSIPNVNPRDPNLRYIDLNGDGMADLLLTEENVFCWYASQGKEGFQDRRVLGKPFDEESGPNVVFADASQSVFLADMTGDGLQDIVRIRNSEVVYWPNEGFGKFGAKITMGDAPLFDRADYFNPAWIRLADLDGSGPADVLYYGSGNLRIWFNQSGNRWAETGIGGITGTIPFFSLDDQSQFAVVDLMGTGTGCLVWSSPLARHERRPLRYIDPMAGRKPYLLTGYRNNQGLEVSVGYRSSVSFYLEDKRNGNPWVTKLPFPVQCVSQTSSSDKILKTRLVSAYSYHHGYYDAPEREFRGFGRVDQTDSEDYLTYRKNADISGSVQIVEEEFYQVPVLTRSWFHTGAFLTREKILTQFEHEYYSNAPAPEHRPEDPVMPAGLTITEWREALRACKGMALRSETYALDGSPEEAFPYVSSRNSCLIKLLQPCFGDRHAVFLVLPAEAISYRYERNPADPRISHNLTLESDDFGNVLKAASISYGRKSTDTELHPDEQALQSQGRIMFNENELLTVIDTAADYRLPSTYRLKTWEMSGFTPAAGDYFGAAELLAGFTGAESIPYRRAPTTGVGQKRLLKHRYSTFMRDDQAGELDPGLLEPLALPGRSYTLCMTPEMLADIFGTKISAATLTAEGKYETDADGNFWRVSGTQYFDATHFFQIIRGTDPFGYTSTVEFDGNHHFYVAAVTDPLGNRSVVDGFNFRTLQPYLVRDINDNRRGVRWDALGVVTHSFVMGKVSENAGDLMDTNAVEISAADRPGILYEYDLFQFLTLGKPCFERCTTRETYASADAGNDAPGPVQVAYRFFNGSGSVLMKKIQAGPGKALQENSDGTVLVVDTSPNLRWIGNGRTILNNKGKPVLQYEPYFSITWQFEDARELVERGPVTRLTYDPAGRVCQTDFPNGTLARVRFDAWRKQSFDPNDLVLESQWYKDRVTAPVTGVATPEEVSAAGKAAAHAGTANLEYLDALGRKFLSVGDNGVLGKYRVLAVNDVEGNLLRVLDPRGNISTEYSYDMTAFCLYHKSADAGEGWALCDVMNSPLRTIDNRSNIFRYTHDSLHRPLKIFLLGPGNSGINTESIEYGDNSPSAMANNLCGQPVRHFDSAGLDQALTFDFKGNKLGSARRLLKNYRDQPDWNVLTENDLETESFGSVNGFDALDRVTSMQMPDGGTIRPVYGPDGKLNKVYARIQSTDEKELVREIRYDEKGMRAQIGYGNDSTTRYEYDPKNFRLKRLLTTSRAGALVLQDLFYTYDPAGNITLVEDAAQETLFFSNAVVEPSRDYTYDALYRLTAASGREHVGQNIPPSASDQFRINLPQPADGAAMRRYTQNFRYDGTGNILAINHQAGGAGSWTRSYLYEAGRNRLVSTLIGGSTELYGYDENGNIARMPQSGDLFWNFRDELHSIDLVGGGTAYYVYDGRGRRIRKVIERLDGSREERIYLADFERYRQLTSAAEIREQINSVHITDDTRRIALIETRTVSAGNAIPAANVKPLTRYQYQDHLGSATLELDDNAAIISYEEYHPYGTTAVQTKNAAIDAAAKRYRFTGMERDSESGFEYHGARYYLPWLGRWSATDPAGIKGGLNLYEYSSGRPVGKLDTSGLQPVDPPVPNADQYVTAFGRSDMCYRNSAEQNTGLTAINIQYQRNVDWGQGFDKYPEGRTFEEQFLNRLTGAYNPMYSGAMTQVALQGVESSTLHFDMRGVDLTPNLQGGQPGMSAHDFHASSEARQVVAHLSSTGAGDRQVTIYIQHEQGVTIIRPGSNTVEGAPLPARLANRMPNINNNPAPPPAGGGGGGGHPPGGGQPPSNEAGRGAKGRAGSGGMPEPTLAVRGLGMLAGAVIAAGVSYLSKGKVEASDVAMGAVTSVIPEAGLITAKDHDDTVLPLMGWALGAEITTPLTVAAAGTLGINYAAMAVVDDDNYAMKIGVLWENGDISVDDVEASGADISKWPMDAQRRFWTEYNNP